MYFFEFQWTLVRAGPRGMAMKRPAAARQADARPKPKVEKPSGSSIHDAAAQPAQGEDVVQSGRKVKRQAEAKAVAKPRLEPPPASSQGSEPQGHKMKRPAACSQADAPRPVQGQAGPNVEKPSSSSATNRAAAAQPATGENVQQSRRKLKCQADTKAVAKPRLEPPPASSQEKGPKERKKNLCHGSGGLPCVFSVQTSGAAARYSDSSCQCPWCNDILLQTALATKKGRGQLSRSLKFFWANNKEIFTQARQRLPDAIRAHLLLHAFGFSTGLSFRGSHAESHQHPTGPWPGGGLAAQAPEAKPMRS